MANVKFRLDHGGMAALLKSAGVAQAVGERADAVAAAARASSEVTRNNVPVRRGSGVSDRARAIVTLAHPAGLGLQAKHGTLSKAVAAAGLASGKVGRSG